ncbi:MAG: PilN domain-containing protein [Planctomycetes bacterium]|jgi:hypothetical protein|nr:PilN domain-containing protein [Planctomycetota bacterium]
MRELDFLPDWYKEDKRRQAHVRQQYVALLIVFLIMMAFNLVATHRVGRAAAEIAGLESQRLCSEGVVHEFALLTGKLNDLKTRAKLVEQIDSRVDLAAVLAELSHLVADPIVLRQVEIVAEPLGRAGATEPRPGNAVRVAGGTPAGEKDVCLGPVKFRVVLTGVAVLPADVAALVCQLDASPYFHQVRPAFYGNANTPLGTRTAPRGPEGPGAARAEGRVELTEFEIACYVANYQEMNES